MADELHSLILKFGTTSTVCYITLHQYVFQYCQTKIYFKFIFNELGLEYVVF